jgi:hypothetical protein
MKRIVDEWDIDIHHSINVHITIGYEGDIVMSERWRRKFALTGKGYDPDTLADTLAEDGSYFCIGSYYFDPTGY